MAEEWERAGWVNAERLEGAGEVSIRVEVASHFPIAFGDEAAGFLDA